jgi:hypothetical protein
MKPRFEKIDEQSATTGMSTQGTLQKYDKELKPSTHNTNKRNDAAPLNAVYNGELQYRIPASITKRKGKRNI